MSNNGGKQASISHFFGPLKTNGNGVPKTDAQIGKKRTLKETQVNISDAMKSKGPFEHSQRNPKKLKPSDSGLNSSQNELNESSLSKEASEISISDGFRQKLNTFRPASNGNQTNNGQQIEIKSTHSLAHKSTMKIPKGAKLTPLEQQVVAIKEKNPDVLLFVECGYKYRFFGEDAEFASKELNIMCRLDHNFLTGSIPTHRLFVHVRRLVAKGYKVGVVKQTETAALKAVGSNKTAPFTRELTALYTRATLIGEDVTPSNAGEQDEVSEGTTSTLMILNEYKPVSSKENYTGISFVAIQPTTGDILYDSFEDSAARTSLWGRLEHIQPVEVVISANVSQLTKRAITAVTTRHGDCIRIEELSEDHFNYSTCLRNLCQLLELQEDKIRRVMNLSQSVTCCLGATLKYLQDFNLEKIIKTSSSMSTYSSEKQFMELSGSSLRNLELVRNSLDGSEKGSLFWVLNKTTTKFGSRMLRQWVVKPLLDINKIKERQEVIEELIVSGSPAIATLNKLLKKAPDFEKALTTIFYKKCSPYEFWLTVSGLTRIHQELEAVWTRSTSESVSSEYLKSLISNVLISLSGVSQYHNMIDEESAKDNKKTSLFRDWSKFSQVVSKQKEIRLVEMKLDEQKCHIAQVLGMPSFSYTTVSGLEYLVEVKNNKMSYVPSSWKKVNMTKSCSRFRTPQIEKLFTELCQLREQLQFECHQAWLEILESFSHHYQEYREGIKSLGIIDALLSLSKVAKANDYCKPEIIEEEGIIEVEAGKHPIVCHLLSGSDQFVANNTNLNVNSKRIMLVTGPNMGGKSCYMRQVALIALMGQIGSFVPAQGARLSILDAIYTRMGASDEIYSGKSTFMVEVGETSDIMKLATKKSLVILDELGRGTSTHDGVAIAMSVLNYFLTKIKCLTIFVTHYLPLVEFETLYPDTVSNFHMSFIVSDAGDDDNNKEVVTFLYQLTSGSARKSYGLNVAKLANVPDGVLERAAEKSSALQSICTSKKERMKDFQRVYSATSSARAALKNL